MITLWENVLSIPIRKRLLFLDIAMPHKDSIFFIIVFLIVNITIDSYTIWPDSEAISAKSVFKIVCV